MKTSSRTIIAGVAVVLALTGCSSTGPTTSATTNADLSQLTYEGTVSVMTRYAGTYQKFFEQMAKDYEAKYPKVTVTLQQESDQGYKDKIKTLTASQSLPDVYFAWAGNYAEQFYDNGLALDLTTVIGNGTEWGSSMAPSALKAFTKDNKSFGIPFGLDAKYMVYNQKLFTQAGLDVPKDLDGLLSACGMLKSKGITPMAFGNIDGWPALHFITQLNSYNVPPETLAADYKPVTATFNDPGYVKSLTELSDIVKQCTVTGAGANGSDYYTERDGFTQGKAAMFYVENLEFGATVPVGSQAEKDGFGIFRLPAPAGAKGDTKSLTGAPDGFLINSKSKNPALAVDFMKFVTDKQNAEALTSMLGIPSPVTKTLTAENSTPQLRASIDDLQLASTMSIWLDTVTVPDVADAYLSGVEGLISGDKTASQVMDSVKSASAQAKG